MIVVHIVMLNSISSKIISIVAPNQDSSQFQFIINTIFGVFNILIAGLIPIWLFAAQNKRSMAFEVNDKIVYLVDPTTQAMTQGFEVIFRLWNSGRQAIVPEDIYGPIEIVFGAGADIREARIIRKNPTTMGVTEPTVEGGGTKISIERPSTPFNRTYWVEIRMIMQRFQKVFEVNSSIRDCEIKEIPQYLMNSRKIAVICTYMVFVIFMLLTLIISFLMKKVFDQPFDLIAVGLIWVWWFARKLDFSPRKLRAMLRVCPLVLVLLFFYAILHFVTINLFIPNLLKLVG